ncbi:twin-arginine translocase TatA/TatE family subunit [Bartonella florencae]|uniref:twin-arginine translocase TatA/TatE family subunit n=1 Tax=Bartonella florencae TaxID=928210 RepID=UPI000315F540|nr:twin-arginine translocase TatA/TatE family subunit [Bartonella florencae]
MGNILSPTHLIVILLVILVLFGRGKVSELMGDVAKGIKAFKKNMKEEEDGIENKCEIADSPETMDAQAQQSEPLLVKRAAVRRKTSSSSTKRKMSTTKEQQIK